MGSLKNDYGTEMENLDIKELSKFKTMVENMSDIVIVLSKDGIIEYVNNEISNILGYNPSEVIGSKVINSESPDADKMNHMFRLCSSGVRSTNMRYRLYDKNGTIKYLSHSWNPIFDGDKVDGMMIVARDVTERVLREEERKKYEEDLIEKTNELERKNITLQELLGQIRLEKEKVEKDVFANINKLIMPYLGKIRCGKNSRKYLDCVKENLENITSSFGREVTRTELSLSPREVEICNYINQNMTTKEIAQTLNISFQTVIKHRKNIRKKIGIHKKSINLQHFLESF